MEGTRTRGGSRLSRSNWTVLQEEASEVCLKGAM